MFFVCFLRIWFFNIWKFFTLNTWIFTKKKIISSILDNNLHNWWFLIWARIYIFRERLLLAFSPNKTPLGETRWLPEHSVFWFTTLFLHRQLGYYWLPTTNCAALVLFTGCHTIPLVTWCFPHYPARKREDFPGGEKYFKHVLPFTYRIYFLQNELYMVGFIYLPNPPCETLISLSLILSQRFKCPISW